jgi:hypothetical protein
MENIQQMASRTAAGLGVGVIVGYAAVTAGFCAIGLSAAGPVAGGLFAAKMGAGLSAGSTMAVLQSAAMSGGVYTYGCIIGGTIGSAIPHFFSPSGK